MNLENLKDFYHLAVTAYALSVVGSPSAEFAADELNKKKLTYGNYFLYCMNLRKISRKVPGSIPIAEYVL